MMAAAVDLVMSGRVRSDLLYPFHIRPTMELLVFLLLFLLLLLLLEENHRLFVVLVAVVHG